MRYLIMSCKTGGGHNSAALAVEKELKKRGHDVDFFDPYDLVNDRRADQVGGAYVKLVQKMPKVFGGFYYAGEMVSRLPFKSPVYYANAGVAHRMRKHLNDNQYDGIIMSHIYPAEMTTMLKNHDMELPPTFYIATDYIPIPFTAEVECDYYCVPTKDGIQYFTDRGMDEAKLRPYGIPVNEAFDRVDTKALEYVNARDREQVNEKLDEESSKIKEEIGLSQDTRYIFVAGGSVGVESLSLVTRVLNGYINRFNDKVDQGKIRSRKLHAIVVCGENKDLYNRIKRKHADNITVIEKTNRMGDYMKAADIVISKPGGLSSTEAAVAKAPLIHITPIPGCETYNVKYFSDKGMSTYVKNIRKELAPAISQLLKSDNRDRMRHNQKITINDKARVEWCDFIESKS